MEKNRLPTQKLTLHTKGSQHSSKYKHYVERRTQFDCRL